MKYIDFIQIKDIKEKLLKLSGSFRKETFLIKINHTPDYDMSNYAGDYGKEYIFKNQWKLTSQIEAVIDFTFDNQKIFHNDDFVQMEMESGSKFTPGREEEFLNYLYMHHQDVLYQNGHDTNDMDEFKFNSIRVASIANKSRSLKYEGTFFGDSMSIDPLDWSVYSWVTIRYVPNLSSIFFYESLLGESYSLYLENKLNLSFFMLFSSFECFVNSLSPAVQIGLSEEENRLRVKICKAFELRFQNLTTHEIFQSLMPKFTAIKDKRNDIAHGKQPISITQDFLGMSYFFTLIFIISHREQVSTFSDLKKYVNLNS
ncbi:hypothetical protein [Pedobacter suwonensis]|uniref:hypothetical protein n=1 Tax=Pedobacter suwonensis TaxID=332999 RepID=UPI0011A7D375|nr:hypothetical protein [Pedobacter suwonensis]